ncbi:MAG: 50S ribosomal protein L10 [Chloroflexi bacterium]|nr:50S ribosomal protein L10 [Chloroflexota bacterium]MCL5074830.1 50S ribosomal protein L10 [Chloroflexota bacterium]
MATVKKRELKSEVVKDLTEKITRSTAAFLTDYRGLSVAEMNDLRRKLHRLGVEYQVTKNTLTRFAAERAGVADLDTLLMGPTAIAFSYKDIVEPAKVLLDCARNYKTFTIKGALLGGRVIDPSAVEVLATLPPREVLLAQVLAGMQAPLTGLVNVLSGTIRGLMYVLQARVSQLSSGS